jgi:tetratricopeptide (TPR) repeat protein
MREASLSAPGAAVLDTARLQEIERLAAADLARAVELARAELAEGKAHPLIYDLAAHGFEQAGRHAEAAETLREGLKRFPGGLQLYVSLGFCLIELDRASDALEAFDRAAGLHPDFAAAHFGRGVALERLLEFEAAGLAFRRAIQLDPQYADAHASLALLSVRRRDHESARRHAEIALDLDPGHMDAQLALAGLDLAETRFEAARGRLMALIEDPRMKAEARANAMLQLGDALDGEGRLPAAFEAFAAGKRELRALHAERFAGPGRRSAIEAVRAMMREFEATAAEAWRSKPDPVARGEARAHAFVFGFARSGTTLLEQVLATHPDVAALGERPTLHDTEAEFLTVPGGVERLAELDEAGLAPYRRAYWALARNFGADPAGKVFVDKSPLNTFKLHIISKLFPEARLLFVVRDPRDVVFGCFRRGFRMNESTYAFTSLEATAEYYDEVMAAGRRLTERLGLEVHPVRHEDLVGDFDGQTNRLCEVLGAPWTPELRNFAEGAKTRQIGTPSGPQLARGLYGEGVGRWRRYAEQLAPVLPVLSPWIERFGYDPA